MSREIANTLADATQMIVTLCGWCGAYLGLKDPEGARAGVSDGICTECRERLEKELEARNDTMA